MKLSTSTFICVGMLCVPAFGQFPGDFYFVDPTPVVAEGQELTLTVEVFAGTNALGAASFDAFYDSLAFEVLSIRPIVDGVLDAKVYSVKTTQGHAVSIFNEGSLEKPFGTITLVEITGRPLISAGNDFQVTLMPRGALTPLGIGFPSVNGFSASISVVDGSAMSLIWDDSGSDLPMPLVPGPVYPWLDPLYGNIPMRRSGAPLLLWTIAPNGSSVMKWFQTYDPGVPFDQVY